MRSIWSDDEPRILAANDELPEMAEVVIIGGGIAGLLCALLLKESGVRAIVLEAEEICSGQTKNTTAKITSQHGAIYDKLTQSFGEEIAGKYGRMNQDAIDEYERIIKERNIACGFRRLPAFLYTKTENGIGQLERERTAAKKAGLPVSVVYETELPFEIKMALKFDGQAEFHPLEFINGIAGELDICEHTRVVKIDGHSVITERGALNAEKIVIATHFPFVNFPGFYFAKMHQERSYVVAGTVGSVGMSETVKSTRKLKNTGTAENAETTDKKSDILNGVYYGIDTDSLSIRSIGNTILVGGMGHRTGVKQTGNPYDVLRKRAERLWPDFREVAVWSAQDCMTLDSLPYVGTFSRGRSDWYVMTGFGKWGMSNSMAAAMVIRDLIIGKSNPYQEAVSPQRHWSGVAVKALAKEMGFTVKNFVTLKGPRCPHLGCRLEWNKYEKTWDCPCHGSRFQESGILIDNPAQNNAAIQSGVKDE